MIFIPRHIAPIIEATARTFPVTVISGPRQVGKTTLLQHQHGNASYVTFDRIDELESARAQPERFLENLIPPAIIDEVQYCPDIFRYIKICVDQKRFKKGSLFLTGSQKFQMMTGIDESLAGRAGIIQMLGLSLREMLEDDLRQPFIPSKDFLQNRHPKPLKEGIWETIFRGDLPELAADHEMDPETYYRSYIETYLRRDVRDLAHVGDIAKFNRFLGILANYHGKILNKTTLASECDASFPTVDRWLGVLEASNIVFLLQPFSANTKKRLVKSPKLYFLNSGILSSLMGFNSAREIEQSQMAGGFFEGFVISEIVKSFLNHSGRLPELCFYRDSNGKEIDLVIQDGRDLYPVEIKKTELARPADTKAFSALDDFPGYKRREGVVICNRETSDGSAVRALPLAGNAWSLPVNFI